MISFKRFMLAEGGNVKVKTTTGIVQAAPFKVGDRSKRVSDIRTAMTDLHDSFYKEHGQHLFGRDRKSLASGSTFAGSTRHLMDSSIPDAEFTKHKPVIGDVDMQVPVEHKDALFHHLSAGRKLGQYTVMGTHRHGSEISAVMHHNGTGEHHQFDFEGVPYEHDEPSKGSQFLRSSNFEDVKAGIKGKHHKILLNAIGGDNHSFSPTTGLKKRGDDSEPGTSDPKKISEKLFGSKADHSKVGSFLGVTDLIKKHIPAEQHQAIYDKFAATKGIEPEPVAHLRKHLNIK